MEKGILFKNFNGETKTFYNMVGQHDENGRITNHYSFGAKMFVFLPSVETESFRAFSISDSKNDGVIVISEVIVCGDRIIETISTKNTKSKLLRFEFD